MNGCFYSSNLTIFKPQQFIDTLDLQPPAIKIADQFIGLLSAKLMINYALPVPMSHEPLH